jgi:SAM-dependent methyltransferase
LNLLGPYNPHVGGGMHIPDKRDRDIAERYFRPFVREFSGCRNVLELASGQGFFLEMLREKGINATGVEIDPELCASSISRGLDVNNRDIFEFLQEAHPGSFDGCFASHIVEHMLPVQVEDLLGLIHSSLRPGSPLVILTPNMANLRRSAGDFWRDPTHVRPYPISALSKLLRKTGWIVGSGEHTDRKKSVSKTIIYGLRNMLIGRYWVGDDVYVIARKVNLSPRISR